MKTCLKCNVRQELNCFGKDKYKKDRLNPYCKKCIKIRSSSQRNNNRDWYLNYAKEYRELNREELSKDASIRYKENKEKYLKLGRESYLRNKKEICLRRKFKRDSDAARKKEAIRQKTWRQKNKILYGSYIRKWQKNNRIKINAHAKVHRAVNNGTLIRNEKCEKCGKKCKTEGHHKDYLKPLDVIWLCRKCHASILEVIEV